MDNRAIKKLETNLWEAADLFRAESNQLMETISRNMEEMGI